MELPLAILSYYPQLGGKKKGRVRVSQKTLHLRYSHTAGHSILNRFGKCLL